MWEVLEEHFEEASFLLSQWDNAMVSGDNSLEQVAWGIERRVFASLDGIVQAGKAADKRLLRPALDGDGATEEDILAASLALTERADFHLGWLFPQSESEEPLSKARTRALGLSRRPDICERLREWTKTCTPSQKIAALEASVRQGSPIEQLAFEMVQANRPEMKAAGFLASRRSDAVLRTQLEYGLDAAVPEVRVAALEASLSFGMQVALKAARRAIQCKAAADPLYFIALAVGGMPEDGDLLIERLSSAETLSACLFAMGFSGWRKSAIALLPFLGDNKWGPLAGEAFSRITGLELKPPYGVPPVWEDIEREDTDTSPTTTADNGLPSPNGAAILDWWGTTQARFAPNTRYHLGAPMSSEVLWKSLRTHTLRGREVLALELGWRTHGAVRVETKTWAQNQLRFLSRPFLE